MLLCDVVKFFYLAVVLNHNIWFPPVGEADEDGLLAIGGDLSIDRLLLAYRCGIFPWFDDNIPLWWSPNPRFVLFPDELKVSKSMQQVIKRSTFDFKINSSFEQVILNCKEVYRHNQEGTWITDAVLDAYVQLHKQGYAHSAESWLDGELVGGLYGTRMGNVFFGESMFSHKSNASKYAFIEYMHILKQQGVQLVDCQVYTTHLESLGARMIHRNDFVRYLSKLIPDN